MKKLICFLILAILLAPVAFAPGGIGLSPPCLPESCDTADAYIGETVEYEFQIFNFEAQELDFRVFLEKDLLDKISIEPETFKLNKRTGVICAQDPGCQIVKLTINLTEIEPGFYSSNYVVETSTKGEGALNVNQQLAGRFSLNVTYPPTLWNRMRVWFNEKGESISTWTTAFAEENKTTLVIILILLLMVFAYFVGTFVHKRRLRIDAWWEVNIMKYGKHTVYTIFDYEDDRIRLSDIYEGTDHIMSVLREEFKKAIPAAIMINKRKEASTDEFTELVEKNKIEVYYLLRKDKEMHTIEKLLKKKISKINMTVMEDAQDDLNTYVKVLNKEKIPKVIKARKERVKVKYGKEE